MKVMIRISKDGALLYEESHAVLDAESFGRAFSDAWVTLQQQQFEQESSIGALMEHLNNSVLERLNGASISLSIDNG